MPVGFYRVMDDNSRVFIRQAHTVGPLLPGMVKYVELIWTVPPEEDPQPVLFSFVALVDDPAIGQVAVNEFDESDNEAGPILVTCDMVQ